MIHAGTDVRMLGVRPAPARRTGPGAVPGYRARGASGRRQRDVARLIIRFSAMGAGGPRDHPDATPSRGEGRSGGPGRRACIRPAARYTVSDTGGRGRDRRRATDAERPAAGSCGRRRPGTAPLHGGPPPRRAGPLHRAHGRPEPPLARGRLLRARGRGDGPERPHLHRHVERRAHAPAPAAPPLAGRPDLRRPRRARPRGAPSHGAPGARHPAAHVANRRAHARSRGGRCRRGVPPRDADLRRQRAPPDDGGPADLLDHGAPCGCTSRRGSVPGGRSRSPSLWEPRS